MRKLRVVFVTASGAMPALVATMLVSSVDGCGSGGGDLSASDASKDVAADTPGSAFDAAVEDPSGPRFCDPSGYSTRIVELPAPGVPASPGQICAVTDAPVASNTAARVTLESYLPKEKAATGFVALQPSLEGTIVGLPEITLVSATPSELGTMTVSGIEEMEGGFRFLASWQAGTSIATRSQMIVKVSFALACEGGTKKVESITKLELCDFDWGTEEWVSSGDACTICEVIAEMAPSPIVSDNRGDDLPLGSVLRLRVIEVARKGRQILLFAETDAGGDAAYEWRVSEGSLERVADDVMLWTLPEGGDAVDKAPFGQVAVWNETGAAVENFLSAVSWKAA